jgi:hypothetical protein
LRLLRAAEVREHGAQAERGVGVDHRTLGKSDEGLGLGACGGEARGREVDLDAKECPPCLVDLLADAAEPLEGRDRNGSGGHRSARLPDRILGDPWGARFANGSCKRCADARRFRGRGADRDDADAIGARRRPPERGECDRDRASDRQKPHVHEYTRDMSFEWLDCTPGRSNGSKLRSDVAAEELADRAGTMFRLGFSQAEATKRLCERIAWEFDPPAKTGSCHKRPDALSDQAIAKIVADTYARRPGGW